MNLSYDPTTAGGLQCRHHGRRNLTFNGTSFFSQTPMTEIMRILTAIEAGEPHKASQLLPLVYNELRQLAAQRLAHEKPGQTLQATALVHEAYLRLVGSEQPQEWDTRGHFFAAAAEAMRRILIERARQKRSLKGGGNRLRQIYPTSQCPSPGLRSICWP